MKTVSELQAAWNAGADHCNQWDALGIDEIVTLAQQDAANEIDRLSKLLKLQQASYERQIVFEVSAERERLVQIVRDFPGWPGDNGKSEIATWLNGALRRNKGT